MDLILKIVFVFTVSTVIFDFIHFILHKLAESRYLVLRMIGRLHEAHHHFFDETITVNHKLALLNLILHVTPEFFVQMLITSLFFFLFAQEVVIGALLVEVAIYLYVLSVRGEDYHHRALNKVGAFSPGIRVDQNYHALHHAYPKACFGSYVKIMDWILGTATPLMGRKIVLTGGNGAFGTGMRMALEKEGVASIATPRFGIDYDFDNYAKLKPFLMECDVLILCHGSKKDPHRANYSSFLEIISLFLSLAEGRKIPPEIWAVGSESELHPMCSDEGRAYADSKRRFARAAKRFYQSKQVIYRHIVPSAYSSKLGWGLMSGSFAARYALFLIKRGFCYVPVTYTGIAWVNYFVFRARFV